MKLAGLDFETANDKNGSICAAGCAVLDNGVLTERKEWLVYPHIGYRWMCPDFTKIHGISYWDVCDCSEFDHIWPELQRMLLSADCVVIHYAPFDLRHLRSVLSLYELPPVEFDYTDSVDVSRKLFPEMPSHSLDAMAEHFGADQEHWEAVGWLHDYDYEKYPDEHLAHTEEPLRELGVPEEDIRAILSHGYGICTDVEPVTEMEKSLFTVDELTGIVQAAARMRPNGITDMEVKSFMKKWKDKKFAAKCNRPLILQGCEMLGMDIKEVAAIVIEGMKAHAQELQLTGSR